MSSRKDQNLKSAPMEFYSVHVAVLGGLTLWSLYWTSGKTGREVTETASDNEDGKESDKLSDHDSTVTFLNFRKRLLTVYVLAVAADWLQGSFMYSIYKNTHDLPESVVAALFATGFVSGALSATVVGGLADRYGRKRACILYCWLYAASCYSVLFSNLPLLFVGRVLGGISTTLLFSVFETWMIAEYRRLGISVYEECLSSLFSTMSTANGITAIVCGVVAEVLVSTTRSEKAPFMASIVCLLAASSMIMVYWAENYGDSGCSRGEDSSSLGLITGWKALIDRKLLAITFTVCCFEGTMYLMVYFWASALISARTIAGDSVPTPLGLIFANLMCAMTLGSLAFKRSARWAESTSTSSLLVQLVCLLSSLALLTSVSTSSEIWRFWAFCVYEFCVGLYYPSMASLKSRLISDEQRGQLYGLLRLPLNGFVVSALGTISSGEIARRNRFVMCIVMLWSCVVVVRQTLSR